MEFLISFCPWDLGSSVQRRTGSPTEAGSDVKADIPDPQERVWHAAPLSVTRSHFLHFLFPLPREVLGRGQRRGELFCCQLRAERTVGACARGSAVLTQALGSLCPASEERTMAPKEAGSAALPHREGRSSLPPWPCLVPRCRKPSSSWPQQVSLRV